MLKFLFILLILGVVLLVVGFAVIIDQNNNLFEKHPDLVIFFDGELDEAQLVSTPLNLTKGDNLTISIASYVRSHKIFFALDGPNESRLIETIFSDYISYPVLANSTGIYTISIGNVDTQNVQVTGFVTERPVFDEEFIKSIGSVYGNSSMLITVGGIMIILSVIILIFQKLRSKNKFKKIIKK